MLKQRNFVSIGCLKGNVVCLATVCIDHIGRSKVTKIQVVCAGKNIRSIALDKAAVRSVHGVDPMATHLVLDRPASIERLMRLGIPALQGIHRELFGKNCTVPHVLYLRRKLAWELQARAEGRLPEEVRQHALNIAWQTTLRTRASSLPSRPVSSTVSFGHDTRLPPPGTLLKRHFKGKPVLISILPSPCCLPAF